MGIDIYTPDSNKIVHKTKVDFIKRIIPETIHLVQYDSIIPVVEVSLYFNGDVYTIDDNENVSMKIRWGRKYEEPFVIKDILGCNNSRDKIYFSIDSDMTHEFGFFNPILELVVNNDSTKQRLGSSAMIFEVDSNPIQQ